MVAAALSLAASAVAACGGSGKIDDPKLPYSFAYPNDFQTGGESTVSSKEQGWNNQTIIARENGQDLVAVQTQPLRRTVTPKLIPRVKREVEQSAKRTGKVEARRHVRVAGLDGVDLTVSLHGTGVPVNARWIYAASDRTLYWIDCQWQSERPAVLKACDEVLRTFRIR